MSAFKVSQEAKLLAARLAQAGAGEVVSYKDLSATIGANVRTARGWGVLNTARRIVREQNRAVFRAVPNEGLRRLTDEEVTVVAPAEMRNRTRRKASRTVRELVTVDYDKLPSQARTAHNVALSMAGALTLSVSPQATKRLTQACEKAQAQLPVGNVLEEFKR